MHPLAKRQLKKAFPQAPAESPELERLLASVSAAYEAADVDRLQLERSLELASDELFTRNRALDARNREMALILDNVGQGFITVSLSGAPSGTCSRAFTTWFGAVSAESRLWTLMLGHEPDLAEWMELGFLSLTNGAMPAEVVLAQLPTRVTRGGHELQIDYRPIGEPLSSLLVVVTDITAELARDAAERVQRELVAVLETAHRDRPAFLAFIEDTNRILRDCDVATAPLAELRRAVHTLKGNAALFGVLTIAEVCHALETTLGVEGVLGAGAWDALLTAWAEFHTRVDRLLGLTERRTLTVDWDEYQAMLATLDGPTAERFRRWAQDPTRPHLERFADEARRLAWQLAKAELDVEIVDNGLAVERERFTGLWAAMIHAVRNAVDHGLETTAERIATGKPAHGHLALRTQVCDGELIIEAEDDGAGIDRAAISTQTTRLGIIDDDDAIFMPGLSTAAAITEISGRGIGMSALRESCRELGGRVELSSVRGQGTRVRCIVPLTGGG